MSILVERAFDAPASSWRNVSKTAHDASNRRRARKRATNEKGLQHRKEAARQAPAGAVLIDGQWHTTQKSIQIAVERLLQQRENRRNKRHETRELLRREHPELFVVVRAPADPKQTTLEVRSDKRIGRLEKYQKRD